MDMKKSLFFVVFTMVLSVAGLAQNGKISYQAVVRNSANQLMYDQDMEVTVSIANSETGTAVYTETQAVHSNANGLISLLIGDGTPVAGSNWDAIQWNKAWVTAVVSQGGAALATHHLPLSAVPYALYADQVDPTALANYLTANHYLTEEVQVLSISNDTIYLTGGSWVKLPAGFSGDYNDLTNKPDLDQYATNVHLNDTLGHYLMREVQILSISNDTIYLTGGSFVKLPAGFSGDYNDLINKPTNVSAFTNDAGYLTAESQILRISNDTIYLTGGSFVKLPAGFSGDYNDLINKPLKSALCDSVQECVTGWISDSTRMVFDTLHTHYVNTNTLRDTAGAIRTTVNTQVAHLQNNIDTTSSQVRGALRDTARNIRADICDSATVCITKALADPASEINHAVDTIARNNIHDTADVLRGEFPVVNNGQVTIAVNRGTVDNPTFQVNQNGTQTVTINIPDEVIVNNGQLTVITPDDTTRFTANQSGNDTVNLEGFVTTEKLNDTLNAYYTKNQVNDTLNAYTTTNKIDTLLGDYATKDSLASYTTTNKIDTLLGEYATKDSLSKYTTSDKVDTLLNAYEKKAELCADVKNCIKDTLSHYTTTDKVDTLLGDYVTTTKLNDTLTRYTTTDKVDTLLGDYVKTTKLNDTLSKYYTQDELNTKLADTAKYALRTALVDTAGAIRTTVNTQVAHLQNNIDTASSQVRGALRDTARNIRADICDSATVCITKALADPASEINHAIDTIALNVVKDTLKAYYDTTRVKALVHDSIGNGIITIQKNGATITDGSFYLNQKTDQTINITVPTQTSELTNNSNLAYTTGNTFSGTHDFTTTGTTITVPSNEDAIKRPVPTTTPATECTNMNAVNVCDLLAVFDSLTKRIDALQQELDELKSATPPVFRTITLSNPTSTTLKVTTDFTSQVSNISSYKFYYSTNSNMSDAHFVESTSPETTLTGLTPHTQYYIAVSASNLSGIIFSDTASEWTKATAPTAEVNLQSLHKGILVSINNPNFQQLPDGRVQIYYKKSDNCNQEDEGFESKPYITLNNGESHETGICDLDANEAYCVMVKVSNLDSTTVYGPYNITPIEVTLSLTANAESPIAICEGDSVAVVFKAELSNGAKFNDYNCTWTRTLFEGASPEPSVMDINDTTRKITFPTYANHAEYTYTLYFAAQDKTCPSVVLQSNKAITVQRRNFPTFLTCEDNLSVAIMNMSGTNTLLNEDPIVSIGWGDGNTDNNPAVGSSHTYSSQNVYAVTVTTDKGCSTTKNVAVGDTTLKPCSVASPHTDGNLYTSTTGGFELTEDGKVTAVNDQDNHRYAVVQIGNQCWMKSNLRTTQYSDGTGITKGTTRDVNQKLYYKPTSTSSFSSYELSQYDEVTDGLYYNWTAVMNGASSTTEAPSGVQGICPKGWHVPSSAEWDTLVNYIIYEDSYADRLSGGCEWVKKSDGNHHPGSYTAARNITGFSAVPAGYFGYDNMFYANIVPQDGSQQAVFWTATQQNNSRAYNRKLFDSNSSFSIDNYDTKQNGYSVRCLRDEDSGGGETSQTDPTVTTGAASPIGETSATLSATISNPDNVNITAKGFEYTSDGNNWTTVLGTSEDNSFTTVLTSLTSNTEYTYKAFITFGENTVYGSDSVFSTQSGSTPEPTTFICGTSTVSDADSNTYNTVQIGSQCWMKENLRSSTVDGTAATAISERFSPDGNSGNVENYGYLYSWAAAMNGGGSTTDLSFTQGICPDGWHLPSLQEYKTLVNFLTENSEYWCDNESDYVAKSLASTCCWAPYGSGCLPWNNPEANNSSGFNAVPAGWYYIDEDEDDPYGDFQYTANFWTSTEDDNDNANYFQIWADEKEVTFDDGFKTYAYSVRCVKNYPPSLSINATPNSSSLALCTGISKVTYTATVNYDNPDGYEYSWSVYGGTPSALSGSSITVTFTAVGTYTIECTAIKGTNQPLTAETTSTVSSADAAPPTLSTYVYDHTLTVLLDDDNISTCAWGDGSKATKDDLYEMDNGEYTLTHTYRNTGEYTITLLSDYGCESSTTVEVTNLSTLNPCKNRTPHTTGYQNNGHDGADDGYETANSDGIISVKDYDGNSYRVTEIGGQCWLAENLRCTHSPKTDNDIVITSYYAGFVSKAAYWYNDYDSLFSLKNYGLLYNWNAAMDTAKPGDDYVEVTDDDTSDDDAWNFNFTTQYHRGICPKGWHMPSKEEVRTLLTTIINASTDEEIGTDQYTYHHVAGLIAASGDWKLCDKCHTCESPIVPGNLSYSNKDYYSFGCLPSGFYNGVSGWYCDGYKECSYFWTSTQSDATKAWSSKIDSYSSCKVKLDNSATKDYGFSVRCVRDE